MAPAAWPAARDRRNVEQFAGEVVDAAEQDEGDRLTVAIEVGDNLGVAAEADDRFVWIEAMKGSLAADRVAVRWERRVLDDDLASLAEGPIEQHHQQVQVHGERVHRHHLDGLGTNQAGSRFR